MGDSGRRILTDRQSIAADRAARGDRFAAGTPAFAGQVYNGGSMPNAVPRWYLTHPVEFDGGQSEGGTYSPVVDAQKSIPVIVLGRVPSVGDILLAEMVGGKWVTGVGGSCTNKICIVQCSTVPIFGATVTILDVDGATVFSCVTGTDGCCQVNLCGRFTVQVTVGGSVVYNQSVTLSNGQNLVIALPHANVVCCGNYAIPYNLTLTDAAGSLAFTYYPNYFYPIWYGGHAVDRTSCSVQTPGGICVSNPPSLGPVKVCYQMICFAGQEPTFQIQRAWSWVYEQGTLTPAYYQDPSGFAPGLPCATAPPASCGSPLTDTASFSADPTSPSPFVLTGTPAAAGSNATADPVGGSITISA